MTHTFKPVNEPSQNAILNKMYLAFGVIIAAGALFFIFCSPSHRLGAAAFALTLCAVVFAANYANKFVIDLVIEGDTLYVKYVTISGGEQTDEIKYATAKVDYKFNATRSSAGWRLKISDVKNDFTLNEFSRVYKNGSGFNAFSKEDLDAIYALLTK